MYLVWAYHLVDDASDPYDFSMHSKMGYTSESYRLVYENTPTRGTVTSGQDSQAVMPSSPAEPTKPPTTARQKSFGFHLSFSFLTIALAAAFSIVIYVH